MPMGCHDGNSPQGDSGFSLNEEWLLHLLELAHGIP